MEPVRRVDERFLADLDDVLMWAARLGVTPGTRFHIYRKTIKWLLAHDKEKDLARIYARLCAEDRITEILSTMVDSIELVETISVLRQNSVDVPPTLLKRAFSGPADVFQEDETSNQARNAMFELSMGTMAARQGLRPALSTENPDVSFQFEGRFVKMECKRVLSEDRVMERLKEGIKQLGKSVQTGSSDIGLVAISLSKLLNLGDKFLVADSPHEALSDEIKKALRANEQTLGSMVRPHAAGFLFYVSTASLVPGRGYAPARSGTFFPLNLAEKPFLSRLASVLRV